MFKKIEIVPRWVIFGIDIILSIGSLFLGKLLKNNFNLDQLNIQGLYKATIIAFLVNSALCAILLLRIRSGFYWR
jgi:hypothetical protein